MRTSLLLDVDLLGDGVFDELSNHEVIATVWHTIDHYASQRSSRHISTAVVLNECVNNLMKRTMLENSEDNISVVIIFFKALI